MASAIPVLKVDPLLYQNYYGGRSSVITFLDTMSVINAIIIIIIIINTLCQKLDGETVLQINCTATLVVS